MKRDVIPFENHRPPLSFLLIVLLLSACSDGPTTDRQTRNWPERLSPPIQDATFGLAQKHLPGAPRDYRTGTHQGFDFFNGLSGRPLAEDEPIVAVADGQVIRIDHAYDAPGEKKLSFYAETSASPGFVGEFALDQVRGRQVWIRHESGHVSRYAHLSRVHPELQPGDPVAQGQPIGLMGNSGIPPTNDQPEPAPHLHFELWSADGARYLGEDLAPIDIHRTVAAIFSDTALPRYARRVVAQIEAGQDAPDQYPPDPFPETGFNVDAPATLTAGAAFAIPVSWDGDEFRVNDFFALLEDSPLGVLGAGHGAWILGAAPLASGGQELQFAVGTIDRYGQTLFKGRTLQSLESTAQPGPREVPADVFELHTEESRRFEADRLGRVALQSLQQTEPYWNDLFHAPVAGNVTGLFGQRIVHGMLRPQHPSPGLLIESAPEVDITASNDGIVGLAETLPIRGRTVAIIHGGGVVSVYSNLGRIRVEVGDTISRGDRLGVARAEAEDDDTRILWEIQVAGRASNPVGWLDRVLPGRDPASAGADGQ